jgi:hypothetical protein
MQPKLTQARGAPGLQGGIGILGVQRRKQRRKEPNQVVKELHRAIDPAVAEPDARRCACPGLPAAAGVEQLL